MFQLLRDPARSSSEPSDIERQQDHSPALSQPPAPLRASVLLRSGSSLTGSKPCAPQVHIPGYGLEYDSCRLGKIAYEPDGAGDVPEKMSRNYLHRLATPGEIPPRAALIASVLAMLVVFAFDLLFPPDIRLHVLYIFPLAVIALHCEWTGALLWVFALSVAFQLSNFSFHQLPDGPFITDAIIAIASSVLTIVLARAVRENYLATANLAAYDSLTGLRNRRSFEAIADMEVARQKRYGGIFSLAILDLDNFKVVNDTEGHHVGDKALRLLADILREHTRKSDSIARLGGDEFAILMPNTRQADCNSLCEQLSASIAQRMSNAGFAITASIGATTFESAPESTSDALQVADKAMYMVKAEAKTCR